MQKMTGAEIETIRILTSMQNTIAESAATTATNEETLVAWATATGIISFGILLVNVVFYAKKWKIGGKG